MFNFIRATIICSILIGVFSGNGFTQELSLNKSQLGDRSFLPDEYRSTSKLLSDKDKLRMEQLTGLLSKRKNLKNSRFSRSLEELELWKRKLVSLVDNDREAMLRIKAKLRRSEVWFGTGEKGHNRSRVTALVIYGGNSFIPVREIEIHEVLGNIGPDIAKLERLKSLSLRNVGKGELAFEDIGKLPSLKRFEPPIDTSDRDLLGMKNLPQIEWFEFIGAYNINGGFLSEVGEKASVQYVNFELSGLTSNRLKELIKLPNLKRIGLSGEVGKGSRLLGIDELKSRLEESDLEPLLTSPEQLKRLQSGQEVVQQPPL